MKKKRFSGSNKVQMLVNFFKLMLKCNFLLTNLSTNASKSAWINVYCHSIGFCDDSGSRNDSKESSECWAGGELHGPRKRQEERAPSQVPPILLYFQGTNFMNSMQIYKPYAIP